MQYLSDMRWIYWKIAWNDFKWSYRKNFWLAIRGLATEVFFLLETSVRRWLWRWRQRWKFLLFVFRRKA